MPSSKAKNNIITVRGRERSLTPKQKSLFSNLGNYGINLSSLKNDSIYINKKLFFEIGFGAGDIIYKQAKLNPDNIYIGIEYYRKGIAQLIEKIEKTNLNNLKILHGDARRILEDIPDQIFDEIWIFFPDPWPKKRHSKRRFLQLEIIKMLHKKIKNGGKLLISSDDKNYIAWTLSLIFIGNYFSWLAESPADWRLPSNNYFGSKYEKKGLKSDRMPYFLKFLKI